MHDSGTQPSKSKSHLSRNLSKDCTPLGTRPVPKLLDTLYGPVSLGLKQDSSSLNVTDFINQVQEHILRLSPSFYFKSNADPPLVQAINYLAYAVDGLIQKSRIYKNFEQSFESNELYAKNRESAENNLQKTRETIQNLNKYDKLLKKKEEKLKNRKKKLISEKKKLKDFEIEMQKIQANLISQQDEFNYTKKYEQEKIGICKEEADKKLNEANELKEKIEKKLEEATNYLKYEKNSLIYLERSLNDTKENLINDQKKLALEKLELEKEKWNVELNQRKLEEKEMLLEMKIQKFDEENSKLENEKIKVQNLKALLDEEKIDLINFKEQKRRFDFESKLSHQRFLEDFNPFDKRLDIPKCNNSDSDLRCKSLDEKEIEKAYESLKNQLDLHNKDLEQQELLLNQKELNLNKLERELNIKIENIKKIENSLIESKIESNDIQTILIPKIKSQLEIIETLKEGLCSKTSELDQIINKVLALESIYNCKNNLTANYPQLENITKELEKKVNELRERENQIALAEEKIENERKEIIRSAEVLKEAHAQVETIRAQNEKINLQEREKIKDQFLKLEAGIKLLSTKELEIQTYKKTVEEKEKILRLKETELAAKLDSPESLN